MLTYRLHIYNCAMAVSAEATSLALSLSQCAADLKIKGNSSDVIDEHLPGLKSLGASLRNAVERLKEALPLEVRKEMGRTNLMRHLHFIDFYLERRSPSSCLHDPDDIVSGDLPKVLELFEKWYECQSPTDSTLVARLEPYLTNGQLNAALREVWPFFKTRMVDMFGLAEDVDGDKLTKKLFGSTGATAKLLPNVEREGYLNLFRGLYALSRNRVVHNDIPPNPEEISAVIALINSAIVKIESAKSSVA